MTDSESFKYRLMTIKSCMVYPTGYEPFEKCEGLIAYFQKGSLGLRKFSSPPNETAVYVSNSHRSYPQNQYVDPVYGFIWPRPDEDYKKYFI